MRLLITGRAGYIGSHVLKALGNSGHGRTFLDNSSTGNAKAITHGALVVCDLIDERLLDTLFKDLEFEAVLHFAGSIVVPNSVADPDGRIGKSEILNCGYGHGFNVKEVLSNVIKITGVISGLKRLQDEVTLPASLQRQRNPTCSRLETEVR